MQVVRSMAARLGPHAVPGDWWRVLADNGFLEVEVTDGQSALQAACIAEALGEANAPIDFPAYLTAKALLRRADRRAPGSYRAAIEAWHGELPPPFAVGLELAPGRALLDTIGAPARFVFVRTGAGWLLRGTDEFDIGPEDTWAGGGVRLRCAWDPARWSTAEPVAPAGAESGLALLLHAAQLVGVMRASVRRTLPYLHQRHQFGRPIGSFQALQHRAVDVVTELRACEALTEFAAWRWGESLATAPDGSAHDTDVSDVDAGDGAPWLQAAAGLVGEASLTVLRECVQFHGGIAMTAEFWLHHWLRSAARLAAYDGGTGARFAALGAAVRQGQRLVVEFGVDASVGGASEGGSE